MGHTDRAALIAWVKDEASDCRASNASAACFDAIAALLEADGAAIEALKELRINANRLCDRQLGGTYEEDCRRSLKRAEAALAVLPAPPVTEAKA